MHARRRAHDSTFVLSGPPHPGAQNLAAPTAREGGRECGRKGEREGGREGGREGDADAETLNMAHLEACVSKFSSLALFWGPKPLASSPDNPIPCLCAPESGHRPPRGDVKAGEAGWRVAWMYGGF